MRPPGNFVGAERWHLFGTHHEEIQTDGDRVIQVGGALIVDLRERGRIARGSTGDRLRRLLALDPARTAERSSGTSTVS